MSLLCTLCHVLMETSSITGCSATSCAMQGHPMELIWSYGQKAYFLPHKHKPKLILSQTWQHFKFHVVKKTDTNE